MADETDRSGRNDRGVETHRRKLLASAGLLASVGVLPQVSGETSDGDGEYAVVQGDRCIDVAPLSGSEPVEAFYDYRLPERYVSNENGAQAGDSLQYSSAGTRDLQREATSLLFLYEGPEGLSLAVVHGSVDGSGGGAATFGVSGLPADGRWVVKDDFYRDPETGEIAGTNYDRWSVENGVHTIDWTWGGKTDGGAFRDLGSDVSVTIAPAFNEEAALYGEHYEGTVSEWQFLAATEDGPRRVSLDMTTPVQIRTGGCATSTSTPTSADPETGGDGGTETEDGSGETSDDAEADHEEDEKEDEATEEAETRRERVKHRKKQRKHRKEEAKHRKKQIKHRKKQRIEEKKERIKHRKKRMKHEMK